jgi:putative heme-binding domain-containing protein
MQRGQPSTLRRVETQLLHFEGQAWNAYTYRWNKEQTDAELVPAQGTNDTFTVTDSTAPGGRREISWRFLGRAECLRCHNAWAGETVSFNWLQLNTPGEISELRRLEDLGVLKVKNPPEKMLRLANPHDATSPLADKARSWLHVNCSTCHRFGAGGGVPSSFNYDQRIEESRAYDGKPVRGDFGLLRARVIAPSDPYRSLLFYRISTEGAGHMPHIGSRLADEHGTALIRDWIASLPAKESASSESAAAHKLAEEIAAALKGSETDSLFSTMNGALALLDALTSKSAIRNSQSAIASATSHTNALVRDLFQRLLPPDQRRQTLGADFNPELVLALKGNTARGRELFVGASQCARCHVCGGAGRAFGPDLTPIAGKYNRAQLLEQILYPSKFIAPEYKTTAVTLRDETEFSGFVLRRTATELVLRDESLIERPVKLSDVKDSHESTLSAMPDGLLTPMTAQEAADLIEYLVSSKPPAPLVQ